MKKAIYFIGLALALLLAAASCQKAPFLTFNGQKSFTFKDTGGSETITFSCNRAWTAKSSESWVTVSPAQGDANEEGVRVTITCAANTTYDPRNATVTIMSEGLSETISISQDTNYGLLSDPTTFNLTNAAQTIEVEVKANVEYTITIDDACKDWISQAGTKALTSTKLSFNIAANESYDDREGKITISQKGSSTSVQPQVITVKQSQTNGLFITTPEYALSNESHDLTIEVKANVSYEVTPEVDWIKYEASSTKALSATTFTLKVDKNETYDQRVGTVKVKGGGLEGIITITQAENLGLFVSPTEVQISKDAQEVEVEVQANVEYDIIVPEEAKGMVTTIKKQGGGDTKSLSATKYLFGVSENTKYVGREASITFKQRDGSLSGTFKISQAQKDTIYVVPVKDSISYLGGSLMFSILSNIEYSISRRHENDWVHVGEVKKSGEIDGLTKFEHEIVVDENEIFDSRRTEMIVSSKDESIKHIINIVQGGIVVIDLSTHGTSNCYIAPLPGWYKFRCDVEGNSFDNIEGYSNASIIWETLNTSTKPHKGDVINKVLVQDNYIYFFVTKKYSKGNALIAVHNSYGEILWSWHIWVTEYCPELQYDIYSVSNAIMMNRDLGALSNIPGDATTHGLLYQWGRKDPFVIQPSSLDGSYVVEESDKDKGTISYSVQHPSTFITYASHNDEDWLYGQRNDNLWSKNKTKYDPCPPGWKVPEMSYKWVGGELFFDGVWKNFPVGNEKDAVFDVENKGILFQSYYSTPPTWYPASGFISGEDGNHEEFGHTGFVWSSGIPNNYSTCMELMFYNGFVTTLSSTMRSRGLSVRCQREY